MKFQSNPGSKSVNRNNDCSICTPTHERVKPSWHQTWDNIEFSRFEKKGLGSCISDFHLLYLKNRTKQNKTKKKQQQIYNRCSMTPACVKWVHWEMATQLPPLIPATKRKRIFWQRGVWKSACDDAVSTPSLILGNLLWLLEFSLKRQVFFCSSSHK